MEELNYPELPAGYKWKKKGEDKGNDIHDAENDIDICAENATTYGDELVAWVTDETGVVQARNRSTTTGKHGKATPVSSFQEGINLIHAQLMLGLIGVGKRLEEE